MKRSNLAHLRQLLGAPCNTSAHSDPRWHCGGPRPCRGRAPTLGACAQQWVLEVAQEDANGGADHEHHAISASSSPSAAPRSPSLGARASAPLFEGPCPELRHTWPSSIGRTAKHQAESRNRWSWAAVPGECCTFGGPGKALK